MWDWLAPGIDPVGGGDRLAAFALQHADAQGAVAAGDVDAFATREQQAAGRSRVCERQCDRVVDADALAGELGLGDRPRIECADPACQHIGRL